MQILPALLLGIGLAMDAFAVSVCKGLAAGGARPRHMLAAGAWFGGFQMLMPLTGWLLGALFQSAIEKYDHWVAFALLALIGAGMLREALSGESEAGVNADFGPKAMLPLALATSIDALAAGVALAMEKAPVVPSVLCIGAVTFVLSAAGVKLGSAFGQRYSTRAQIAGGILLILLGLRILLEGVGVLAV